MTDEYFVFMPDELVGEIVKQDDEAPIPDATWYQAEAVRSGMVYRFPAGTLQNYKYLTTDLLLTGQEAGVFVLLLSESDYPVENLDYHSPIFAFQFSLLPEASARLRMPLEAVNQNKWMYDREGALLKPRCAGKRVDLAKVQWMAIVVFMKADAPVRWCMQPITATKREPALIEKPFLPKGVLLDELGQTALWDWPGKSTSREEVNARLQQQLQDAPRQQWPEGFSRWGGWTGKQFEATGFFRTQWDDEANRWWMIDPDGYVFWSTGQDCVNAGIGANFTRMEQALPWMPEPGSDEYEKIVFEGRMGKHIDYLKANLIRAYGMDTWYENWKTVTISQLKQAGFNTVANWSDWKMAKEAGFPYVRPMGAPMQAGKTPGIYRDFPDVFDPQFDIDAAEFAKQLEDTRDDPAFIGYFMMNEPTWGFAMETPAAGMLFNTPKCASRQELAAFMRKKYADDAALASAWGIQTTFAALAEGAWNTPLSEAAQGDLAEFSAIMVEKFFGTLSAACRKVDPNHLNLGIRYHIVPPSWAQAGMKSFDVFSINCYQEQVPADDLKAIHDLLNMPTMIGEWHFGAMDVGLPATGVGPRVRNQAERGQAYRAFVERAVAIPWCVGVHHFTHYDQSALGRFDGEMYNIGFYDICNRPYTELVDAARLTHERLYPVGLGDEDPFTDAPEFLSRFFI